MENGRSETCRCILAARSDFFETMLTHNQWPEAQAPVLDLDTQEVG